MHVFFKGKKGGNGFGLSCLRAGLSVVKHWQITGVGFGSVSATHHYHHHHRSRPWLVPVSPLLLLRLSFFCQREKRKEKDRGGRDIKSSCVRERQIDKSLTSGPLFSLSRIIIVFTIFFKALLSLSSTEETGEKRQREEIGSRQRDGRDCTRKEEATKVMQMVYQLFVESKLVIEVSGLSFFRVISIEFIGVQNTACE